MYFLFFSFFVLNQCKMLVADHGSGSVKVRSVLVNPFSRALPGWGLGLRPSQV